MSGAAASGCGALLPGGQRCGAPTNDAAGLGLCDIHLLAAYDWEARVVGLTDLLPSPCLACGSRLGVRYPSGWQCAVCEWRVGELPEADARAPRVEVVYYLRFQDRIKIGTSANPRSRLGQLRFDELLAFEPGGRPVEQARHRQFAAHRFEGSEWFHANPALAAHIGVLARGIQDPWDQYRRWVSERVALGYSD